MGTNLGISSRQSAGNAKHLPVTFGYLLVIFGHLLVTSGYQFVISSYKFVTFGRSKHPSLKMPWQGQVLSPEQNCLRRSSTPT